MKMDDEAHNLLLRDEIVTNELAARSRQKLGIAKNAREEKEAGAGCEGGFGRRAPGFGG